METKKIFLNGLIMLIDYTHEETEGGCEYCQIHRVQVGLNQMAELPLDDNEDLARYHEMLGEMSYQQAMEWEAVA